MLERPETKNPWGDEPSPYIEIGGDNQVRQLAETFYDTIEAESPILREMLPKNTSRTRQKFCMFLTGWLGGPPLYEMKWGHPQLRRRHFPFKIGDYEAQEWMRCMRSAVIAVGIAEPLRTFLDQRFDDLAQHMRNAETVPRLP